VIFEVQVNLLPGSALCWSRVVPGTVLSLACPLCDLPLPVHGQAGDKLVVLSSWSWHPDA